MNAAVINRIPGVHAPRYATGKDKTFSTTLHERANAFFRDHKLPRRGGTAITLKIIAIAMLFMVSYGLLISQLFSGWILFGWAALFGISHVLIVFCIGHDASHQALYNRPRWNKFLSYGFNLVGTNAYLWNITHNQIHHTYPNISGFDTDVHQSAPLIRIIPEVAHKSFHRYQHIYGPVLYLFYSLYLVFQRDYEDIGIWPKDGSALLKDRKHPRREMMNFIFWKIFYILYTIVIPFWLLDVGVLPFILAYVSVHMIMSVLLAIVLIPVHMVDEAAFTVAGNDHEISDSWMVHVIKNTVDYSRVNKVANWLFGGLNTHLVHHLFPAVCHVHYIALSEVVRKTCKEFNIEYRYVSHWEAIMSHWRLLKRMSRP